MFARRTRQGIWFVFCSSISRRASRTRRTHTSESRAERFISGLRVGNYLPTVVRISRVRPAASTLDATHIERSIGSSTADHIFTNTNPVLLNDGEPQHTTKSKGGPTFSFTVRFRLRPDQASSLPSCCDQSTLRCATSLRRHPWIPTDGHGQLSRPNCGRHTLEATAQCS